MILREWMILPNNYWTDKQLESYLDNCGRMLETGMVPVIHIIGPAGAANLLLMVMARIAIANPPWIPEILRRMSWVADNLLQPEPTRH